MNDTDLTLTSVLAELKELGTEQNRKIYRRHGVTDEMFGVSYANQEKLARRIKKAKRSDLAIPLWDSGNHDARVLATKILAAETLTQSSVNQLVRGVTHSLTATGLADVVAQMEAAPKLAEKWIAASASRSHWKVLTGWALIASIALAKKHHKEIADSWFSQFLKVVVSDLTEAPNEIRHQMNGTLIAIGCRNETLREQALKVAKQIGKVTIDHGETSCKTPDAETYIKKVWSKR